MNEIWGLQCSIFQSCLGQIFWTFTEAISNCDTGFCQTYPFDTYGDALQDKELVGHVFHSSVISNPVQCYMLCKDDCRCLSFNYKENNDVKYCELNEASHFTHDSFHKSSVGSRYYNLRRFLHGKNTSGVLLRNKKLLNELVFCDFNSEPEFAWNLIESFSLSNKSRFQKDIVLYDDYQAISGDAPNWHAYLIKRPYLLWLRNSSTHWRATCRYNTDGTVYTDYLRASLEDFDIIIDQPTMTDVCRPYEYVNIRGNECVNCTARTWYKKGDYPLHIDSGKQNDCDFDEHSKDAVSSEDNFGYYSKINSKFRCTSSDSDTTQLWIGGK
ncbi:uncharacterized protein LOC111322809 [Stylophora pistillata]|uniref:uncharacterized protein LOC111322809 n=1 Tax=Stylophora pistillata TaxID=50429 RepID=UPI000C03F473|nr:uncharacterized protein LOC111322809 [Stylophora pistillata]